MSSIKAVIFDLDGTLLYTAQDLCDSVNEALSLYSLPHISVEQCIANVGNGVRSLIQRSSGIFDDDDKTDKMLAIFKSYYKENMEKKTRPYDGIVEMLKTLRRMGIKVAVLSNKYDEATKRLCDNILPGLIDIAAGECESIPRKPDPTGLCKVMDMLGVSCDETVYVGDSGSDITTAINARAVPMGVSWGFRSAESLASAGAEYIANTADEVVGYIEKL